MSYTVKVDGTTYYCADLNTQYSIESATGTKQQELLSQAVQNGTAAEVESELQTYDDKSGTTIKANADTTMTKEQQEQAVKDYFKEVGIDDLNENSSIDDVINIYNEVEKTANQIDREIKSLKYDDPKKVEDEITKINKAYSAMSSLLQAIGEEAPDKYSSHIWACCGVGAVTGAIALGGITASVAAGTLVATSLTVASCTWEIPVAGWIVAGVAALVALGGFIWGLCAKSDAENKFNELKENLNNGVKTLDGNMETLSDNYTDKIKTEVTTANTEIEDLISDDLSFENLTDTTSIENNIDKIIEYQEKFEPHYNLCQKYNFEPEGFTDFMKKLGTGDQRLYRAQSYLDKYATKAKTELNGEIGSDTNSLNEFYDKIGTLIENVKKKGLKTNSLERIQKSIRVDNNKEVYTLSNDISSGKSSTGSSSTLKPYTVGSSSGTGSTSDSSGTVNKVTGLVSNSDVAGESAQAVIDNSSAYQTSTDKLTTVQNELIEGAQSETDSYGKTLSQTDGKSIEELNGILSVARSALQGLSKVQDKIDIAPVSSSIDTITNAKQTLADKEAESFATQAQGTTNGTEIGKILESLRQKQGEVSQYDVDTSKFDEVYATIVQNQQNYVNQMAQNFMQQANMLTKSDDAPMLIESINTEIQSNSFLDTSALQALIGPIQEKAAKLKQQEIEELQAMLKGENDLPTIGSMDDEVNIQADGGEAGEEPEPQNGIQTPSISFVNSEDDNEDNNDNNQNTNNIFAVTTADTTEQDPENENYNDERRI